MVEDDPQGVTGFRVCREAWPEEEKAIAAVESLVAPLKPGLKLFRNRLGFHGSRSRAHEEKGLDVFAQHSGTAVWEAMKNFKSLGAALFKKDLDRQNGVDSEPGSGVDRHHRGPLPSHFVRNSGCQSPRFAVFERWATTAFAPALKIPTQGLGYAYEPRSFRPSKTRSVAPRR